MDTSALPRLAVIAAGATGSAVAKRFTRAGCTVYINLDGHSEATRQRPREAGVLDAPSDDIVVQASWTLSVLPPRNAVSFPEREVPGSFLPRSRADKPAPSCLVLAGCNPVGPETLKRIAGIFVGTGIKFVEMWELLEVRRRMVSILRSTHRPQLRIETRSTPSQRSPSTD